MKSQKNNSENLKQLAREWFLRARDDERSSEILLKENGSPNTICFLSHQMAEKYLKGYLISQKVKFPKIHDLAKLLKLCEKTDPEFTTLNSQIQYLRGFYIETRYPGDYPQFSFEEAKRAFQKAFKIKGFVLNKVK